MNQNLSTAPPPDGSFCRTIGTIAGATLGAAMFSYIFGGHVAAGAIVGGLIGIGIFFSHRIRDRRETIQ